MPMFAATVIQYSLPASVNGSSSAHAASRITLNTRCCSDSTESQRTKPTPLSAPSMPPANPRNDRKIAPAYGMGAPTPPVVSIAATANSTAANDTSSTR